MQTLSQNWGTTLTQVGIPVTTICIAALAASFLLASISHALKVHAEPRAHRAQFAITNWACALITAALTLGILDATGVLADWLQAHPFSAETVKYTAVFLAVATPTITLLNQCRNILAAVGRK